MKTDIPGFEATLKALLNVKTPLIVAIDGGSCSGKTTLARALCDKLGGNIIHMDDFYLRPEQRTPERYDEPGGNVDRERFLNEVLLPLKTGKHFSYRPFNCKTMQLAEPITVEPAAITFIEGSYSLHPALIKYYDVKVFLEISKSLQGARVVIREGANAKMFTMRWIPLEERYHYAFHPERRADYTINVG